MKLKRKRKNVVKEVKITTIKQEIQRIIIGSLAVSLLLSGGIASYLNYTSSVNALEGSMPITTAEAAEEVKANLKATMNTVEMLGTIPQLSSDTLSPTEKQYLMDRYKDRYQWDTVFVTDKSGINKVSNTDISDRPYFNKVLSGTTVISDPAYNKVTGKLTIIVAAPLWKGGMQNTQVAGVVGVSIDAMFLSDIVTDIKVSKNGSAYIINGDGATIAHENFDLVINGENDIEAVKTDSSLKEIAALEKKMTQGQSGFGKYTYAGKSKYMAYAPIGINGWSLSVTTPTSDFTDGIVRGIIIIGISTVIILLFGAFMGKKPANVWAKPSAYVRNV